MLCSLEADEFDTGKLKADLPEVVKVAQEDSKDVQNFQDQWKSDTGAAQKLAAQVESANLPAAEMAVADQVGAIENNIRQTPMSRSWTAAGAVSSRAQTPWRRMSRVGKGVCSKMRKTPVNLCSRRKMEWALSPTPCKESKQKERR